MLNNFLITFFTHKRERDSFVFFLLFVAVSMIHPKIAQTVKRGHKFNRQKKKNCLGVFMNEGTHRKCESSFIEKKKRRTHFFGLTHGKLTMWSIYDGTEPMNLNRTQIPSSEISFFFYKCQRSEIISISAK